MTCNCPCLPALDVFTTNDLSRPSSCSLHASAGVLFTGAEIEVSPVMGKGFPMDKAPPAEIPYLLIFATGTGIAPIKALIDANALQVCPNGIPIQKWCWVYRYAASHNFVSL